MRTRSVTMRSEFRSELTPQSEAVTRLLKGMSSTPMNSSSGGIVIPNERTQKQRNYAFCSNPTCAEDGLEFRFEIEDSLRPCPKCGAYEAPLVGILAKTHLLVQDKKGNFKGQGGIRYRLACDPENKRFVISTVTNHELATSDRKTSNCLDCLAVTDPKTMYCGLPLLT